MQYITTPVSSPYTSIKGDVLQKLEENFDEIQNRFGIETIGIFGSVSRGEDTQDSDVDILYSFSPGRGGMHDMAGLLWYLEALFERRVDLISAKYISPFIREYVVTDAILYGKQMSLA